MFVLQCQSGTEQKIAEKLRRYNYTVFVPTKTYRERKSGTINETDKILFDGYVFVVLDRITPQDHYNIKRITNCRFLNEKSPLPEAESEYIRILYNSGNCIGISSGYVDNGKLKITGGWLTEHEHRIIKWDRRQGRATAQFSVYGKPYKISFCIDIKNGSAANEISVDSSRVLAEPHIKNPIFV